jgi:hypothetical protein
VLLRKLRQLVCNVLFCFYHISNLIRNAITEKEAEKCEAVEMATWKKQCKKAKTLMIEHDNQENQGEYQFVFADCGYLKHWIALEPAQTLQAFNLHDVEQDIHVSFTISFTKSQFLITAQFSGHNVTDKSYQGTQIQLVPQQGSVPCLPLGPNLPLTKNTTHSHEHHRCE